MHDGVPDLKRICTHCGAVGSHKLGPCTVCFMTTCDRCGNIQHVHGEHRVIHNSCLADSDHGFTMIRIVK